MLAGHARTEITPAPECPLIGYDQRWDFFPEGGNQGAHDPLFADCLVLDDGCRRAALVTLDLCILESPLVARLRRAVGEAAATPTVILACSHTHSGPYPWEPGWQNTEPVPDHLHTASAQDYAAFLEKSLVTLAAEASTAMLATSCALRSSVLGIGYTRRVRCEGNRIGMAWNLRDWDGPEPTPAGDPSLQVLVLRRDGGPDVILWNTAAHPVVLGKSSNVVSADWPGAARSAIESSRKNTRAMFLHGAGGDTHPWLATGDDPADLAVVAAPAAASVLLLSTALPPSEALPSLAMAEGPRCTALRIGPARLLASPCELFGATGAAMRNSFPDLLLATTANGWTGYCPPPEIFPEGGYEINAALTAGNTPQKCAELIAEGETLLQSL